MADEGSDMSKQIKAAQQNLEKVARKHGADSAEYLAANAAVNAAITTTPWWRR